MKSSQNISTHGSWFYQSYLMWSMLTNHCTDPPAPKLWCSSIRAWCCYNAVKIASVAAGSVCRYLQQKKDWAGRAGRVTVHNKRPGSLLTMVIREMSEICWSCHHRDCLMSTTFGEQNKMLKCHRRHRQVSHHDEDNNKQSHEAHDSWIFW